MAEAYKRDKSLSKSSIDEDYLAEKIEKLWSQGMSARSDFIDRKIEWDSLWRDTDTNQSRTGPFPNSANFKSKMTLSYGKAVHARLWQMFSNPNGFFSVRARQEVFREKETKIQQFMNWVLEKYANSKQGVRREFDRWLWDIVFNGSGYMKAYWKREEFQYMDVERILEETDEIVGVDQLTGESEYAREFVERDVEKTETVETPCLERIKFEDVILPYGQPDPQTSDWVECRAYMDSDDLKYYADNGMFFKDAVEESLEHRQSILHVGDESNDVKQNERQLDGIEDAYSDDWKKHVVIEFTGKVYVNEREVDEDENNDNIKKRKREIVAWLHLGSKRILGWTYLHRVSPGGVRPIFKTDYVVFPDRNDGVGIPELIADEVEHIEAIRNLRMDNGILASTPMGFYRASSSGLKPQVHQVTPGQLIPVDDVNDVKFASFPFLSNFGYQEEGTLQQDIQKKVAMSELQLGTIPDKVGALRNATGSNLLASESNIQLQIHFDRIAHSASRILQFLFRLARERMPAELYFRVQGDRGQPIFGKVDREDLKGEFDFDISVDILSQSETERQQKATLALQTLLNPVMLQSGVIQPNNIYALVKDFLVANRYDRVNEKISEPPQYPGDMLTPTERVARIALGRIDDPLIEDTVRMDENHEKALKFYELFKNSDEYGMFTQDRQVAALENVIRKHQEFLTAIGQSRGGMGMPNPQGVQMPQAPGAPVEQALTPDFQGEANGPIV